MTEPKTTDTSDVKIEGTLTTETPSTDAPTDDLSDGDPVDQQPEYMAELDDMGFEDLNDLADKIGLIPPAGREKWKSKDEIRAAVREFHTDPDDDIPPEKVAGAHRDAAEEKEAAASAAPNLIHILRDGLTFGGKIWYRGEECHTAKYRQATVDRNGDSLLDLDDHDQIARYGDVIFRAGPWPYKEGATVEAGRKRETTGRMPKVS